MELKQAIQTAIEYLGKDNFANFELTYRKSNDLSSLLVKKSHNHVDIVYGSLSSLFRGLTLVKERKGESFEADLKQKFDTNGLMLDCSRNGVLKNEKVKELILLSALMGHNRLLLYTEDTYKLDKYPYFGYLRGGYSKEDIKEFVEYGESFGVELIPCIQTLGHMYQALKWGPHAALRDGNDTLLVDSEEVYKFIEESIKFSRDCFSSKDIHIGMDESFQMGLFRYLNMHGYKDRVEMFSRHLSRVIDICKKYDFSPMIWSDMYFRLNSEDQEYYRNSPLPEKTLKLIPKDVQLVYWDYYHEDVETYTNMIKYHKQANNHVLFAGGSWRWKGHAPSIARSMQFTKSALDACLNEKIKDVFITAWGDDGSECSFFSILPVLAQASIMSYEEYDEKKIDSLLQAICDERLEDFLTMDLPDRPAKKLLYPMYNPSKFFLYQDVLLGLFDKQVKDDFSQNYAEFAVILKEKSQNSSRFAYVYDNLAKLCDCLTLKVDLGVKLRKAYKENDKAKLANLIDRIEPLLAKIDLFNKSVEKQWMIECRPFGYEVLDGRLGFLKNRLSSVKQRVQDYLEGKIDKIEELEQEILPYDGFDYEVSWNHWLRTVSPSN